MPRLHCDSIIEAGWVLPIAPVNTALVDYSVAIHEGLIVAVGTHAEVAAAWTADEHLTLHEHILLPGLVNAHGHLAMTLFRGLADDLPLDQWLTDHIWPLESRWVDPEFVRDGATLALLEMLTTGTTCCSDMYFYPEITAEAARAAGIRAQIAFPIVRFANTWSRDANEAFHKGLALHDAYRDQPLINIAFGPHAPNSVARDDLIRALTLADELEAPIHIHLHENASEVQDARKRLGMSHIEWLAELGLLIPRLQAVHMTQVTEGERELVADAGVSVVHCPHSNLKLGSGHCDVSALQAAGVRVGLGTDGAASNNGLDMFSEMRAAALVAKTVTGDVTASAAFATLRMATLGGAEAMSIDDQIGSLEPGKSADLIAVDTACPGMTPLHQPESQLIYTAAGTQVSHVWVAGNPVVTDGDPVTLDAAAVRANAKRWRERLQRPEAPLR
ncbi:MAG: TRZ/ATZ family hydrolase [Gammaproteobacteria bacterium]|nr:MAG: TRZ/ATZ family hydrolase [Gammaproteobacteria bacterium]